MQSALCFFFSTAPEANGLGHYCMIIPYSRKFSHGAKFHVFHGLASSEIRTVKHEH